MPVVQYLHGDTAPVNAPITTAKAVDVGDLVGYQNVGGTIYKASEETWSTDLLGTQTAFAGKFLGVSGQQKAANAARVFGNSTDNTVRVDTAGIFEFDFAGGTPVNIGDIVAPAKASGNALLDNTVVLTGNGTTSAIGPGIGVIVERAGNPTRVKVRLFSRVAPQAKIA